MKKTLLFITLLGTALYLNAQNIEKVEINNTKYGLSNLKKAPKRIYINSFNINYEFYKEAVNFKSGGNGGRLSGNKSSATARAAVGLGGIDAVKMQEKVNLIYNNCLAKITKEGYEIISYNEASNTEIFKDWQLTTGPIITENLSGIITCIPDGFTSFYKRKTNKGEIKKGFLGGIGLQPKLSKELGDAIIADVNLFVMFSENGGNWSVGGAKVKIKTNLRLVKDYAIAIPKKLKKKKSIAGKLFGSVQIKGATNIYPANSNVSFSQGKVGLGAKGNYTGTLKNDLEINNVVEKQKIVAYQKQGSFVPTSFSSFSDYIDAKADRFSSTAKWIEVDGDKYADGFYNACNTFLDNQLDVFFSKIK